MSLDRPEHLSALRPGEVRAAFDLGTNSFHLVVARVDENGQFDVLAKEKDMVRLGSGAGDMAELTGPAMDRGIDALNRFRRIAGSYDASVSAVATSALREAKNRDVFLERARREAGVEIDVVSGVEEARLIHLGVLQALPLYDERIVVVDIGGGSTEFLVGDGTDVRIARSTKVGAIRLTDRFFPGGRVRGKAVDECRTHVRAFLVPTLREVRAHGPFVAVGSSGTITTIARMAVARRGGDPAASVNGASFERAELRAIVDDLAARKRSADRSDIAGLDDRRRDIIVAGAVLLDEILEALEVDRMIASEGALREGILVDQAASAAQRDRHHLADIRRQSVLRMAEMYHEDPAHIARATELALQLFDGLAELHGLGDAERDYLEAAGLLHNVGLFISHAAHHKHSYYVIRHSDQLSGFTDREVELIAQVARYHRKSSPKPAHIEFQALREADKRIVRLLAGMLRIGIALDRTRQRAVVSVSVQPIDPDRAEPVAVDVRCDDEVDMSLELYTAHQRTGLLENALGRPVDLRILSARAVS